MASTLWRVQLALGGAICSHITSIRPSPSHWTSETGTGAVLYADNCRHSQAVRRTAPVAPPIESRRGACRYALARPTGIHTLDLNWPSTQIWQIRVMELFAFR